MAHGTPATESFSGVRQERKGDTPSTRFEVRPGCYLTLFDDGRTKFTVNEVESGLKIRVKNKDSHNLPGGGAAIETIH